MPGASPPSNYNAIDLAADSQEIELAGYRILRIITDVTDRVEAVITLTEDLKGAWTSAAAQLADEAIGHWNAAATQLFGAGDPKQGAMNELVDGLITAAGNFADAEQSVMNRFRGLFDPTNPFWSDAAHGRERFGLGTWQPPVQVDGPAVEVDPGVQVIDGPTRQSLTNATALLGH